MTIRPHRPTPSAHRPGLLPDTQQPAPPFYKEGGWAVVCAVVGRCLGG